MKVVKMKFDNGEVVEIIDKRLRIVSGWASVQIKDVQGHVVSAIDLVKAMISYMADGGIILYGHTNTPVGRVLYWDLRKHEDTGEPGIYIVAQIGNTNVIQDRVWELVKSGTITGFSIGGYGKPVDEVRKNKDGKEEVVKKVTEIILKEISVVEHPANQSAVIEDYNELAKGFKEHFEELKKTIEDFEKEVLLAKIELGLGDKYEYLANYYALEVFGEKFSELCEFSKKVIIDMVFKDYKKEKIELFKKDSCKARYYNEEEGHFKGRPRTGERFNNCVKYFMNCKGLSEDAAKAQCAEIARRKYGPSAGR